jgi:hypothetical protein
MRCKRWKFGISMPTQHTSSPSHCVTLSLKSLDALRWFSGLDQIGQGGIRLCVRLHLLVLVHQQITDNPRKHDATPRIQMRPVIVSVLRSSRVSKKASALDPRTTRPVSPVVERYLKYFFCESRSMDPFVGSKKVTADRSL